MGELETIKKQFDDLTANVQFISDKFDNMRNREKGMMRWRPKMENRDLKQNMEYLLRYVKRKEIEERCQSITSS